MESENNFTYYVRFSLFLLLNLSGFDKEGQNVDEFFYLIFKKSKINLVNFQLKYYHKNL
jgi:hypothetical protein